MSKFSQDRLDRQEWLNNEMSDLGNKKFYKNSERNAKVGGFGETKSGVSLGNEAVAGFVETIDMYCSSQLSQRGPKSTLVRLLLDKQAETPEGETVITYRVNPATVARIAIKAIMGSLIRPEDKRIIITTSASVIGENLEYAVKTVILETQHAEEKRKQMELLRMQGRTGDEDDIRKTMIKLAEKLEIDHVEWTNQEKLEIGYITLMVLKRSPVLVKVEGYGDEKQEVTFGDFFLEVEESTFDFAAKHLKSRKTFKISKQGIKWMEDNEDFLKGMSFSYLPMVIPPADWTIEHGGFYEQSLWQRYTLMKNISRSQLAAAYEDTPEGFDTLIRTINAAQAVPFKVNKTVFNAVKWVNENEVQLDRKGIPEYMPAWEKFLGSDEKAQEYFELKRQMVRGDDKKLTKEAWAKLDAFIATVVEGSEKMTIEECREVWWEIKDNVRNYKRAEDSKKILVKSIIGEAGMFLEDDIYFPYNADFRGRIYPISGLFSPQGSDTSKGMLEFAEPTLVVSEEAVDMIAFQIANSHGQDDIDKESIADRIEWTWDNSEEIIACAEDFKTTELWREADKPFLFLLGCIEWKKYIESIQTGEDFYTTLPIAFDGSVNGIQHFSALLRDPDGAEHVNLTPGDKPADAYQVVADKAKEMAQTDTLNKKWKRFLVDLDVKLKGKIFNRKTSKRATMTLPYGVSESSAGDYVAEELDKHLSGLTVAERKNSRKFMKKMIWKSIEENIGAPIIGKDYFQDVAESMARSGKGLKWFTPTGLPIMQNCMEKAAKYKRIKTTVFGETLYRKIPTYTYNLSIREQRNGISPNFIHSFDSAHLQNTVLAAVSEGMDKFLLIHDSFGVDAESATRFNEIIREQFVGIYHNRDFISEFHDECVKQLGKELLNEKGEVITPLTLGDFDVRQVLKSDYFFA